MAATRFNGGIDVAALIQRSRRSRLQTELPSQSLNDLLRKVSFFQAFSDAEIEKLIHSGEQIQLAAGEFICYEDEPGNSFYIILSGSVEVYLEKLQKELRTLTAGAFLANSRCCWVFPAQRLFVHWNPLRSLSLIRSSFSHFYKITNN